MLPVFGLYTHIRANRIRSRLLVFGLFALAFALTYGIILFAEASAAPADLSVQLSLAGRHLLLVSPVVAGLAAGWVWFAMRFNARIVRLVTGAREAEAAAEPRLFHLLETLCISRGMVAPRLQILETPARNAYATGVRAGDYAITVTRGLLEALDEAEIEAVLAHELTHIRNEDVRLMVIAVVVAGAVAFFAELFFRMLARFRWSRMAARDDDRGGGGRSGGGSGGLAALLLAAALIALAWLLSQMVRFALSRSREYLADAGAVELTKNPDAMISALRKIEGRGELPDAPSGLMEMCVDNPRAGFADLFATHPSIDSRVAALVRHAGGRDVAPVNAEPGSPGQESPGQESPGQGSSGQGSPVPGPASGVAGEGTGRPG